MWVFLRQLVTPILHDCLLVGLSQCGLPGPVHLAPAHLSILPPAAFLPYSPDLCACLSVCLSGGIWAAVAGKGCTGHENCAYTQGEVKLGPQQGDPVLGHGIWGTGIHCQRDGLLQTPSW